MGIFSAVCTLAVVWCVRTAWDGHHSWYKQLRAALRYERPEVRVERMDLTQCESCAELELEDGGKDGRGRPDPDAESGSVGTGMEVPLRRWRWGSDRAKRRGVV
jgi:hypothetical protein